MCVSVFLCTHIVRINFSRNDEPFVIQSKTDRDMEKMMRSMRKTAPGLGGAEMYSREDMQKLVDIRDLGAETDTGSQQDLPPSASAPGTPAADVPAVKFEFLPEVVRPLAVSAYGGFNRALDWLWGLLPGARDSAESEL